MEEKQRQSQDHLKIDDRKVNKILWKHRESSTHSEEEKTSFRGCINLGPGHNHGEGDHMYKPKPIQPYTNGCKARSM